MIGPFLSMEFGASGYPSRPFESGIPVEFHNSAHESAPRCGPRSHDEKRADEDLPLGEARRGGSTRNPGNNGETSAHASKGHTRTSRSSERGREHVASELWSRSVSRRICGRPMGRDCEHVVQKPRGQRPFENCRPPTCADRAAQQPDQFRSSWEHAFGVWDCSPHGVSPYESRARWIAPSHGTTGRAVPGRSGRPGSRMDT